MKCFNIRLTSSDGPFVLLVLLSENKTLDICPVNKTHLKMYTEAYYLLVKDCLAVLAVTLQCSFHKGPEKDLRKPYKRDGFKICGNEQYKQYVLKGTGKSGYLSSFHSVFVCNLDVLTNVWSKINIQSTRKLNTMCH